MEPKNKVSKVGRKLWIKPEYGIDYTCMVLREFNCGTVVIVNEIEGNPQKDDTRKIDLDYVSAWSFMDQLDIPDVDYGYKNK